jgi:CubicO group peptidase (beta-lactamase class C family)
MHQAPPATLAALHHLVQAQRRQAAFSGLQLAVNLHGQPWLRLSEGFAQAFEWSPVTGVQPDPAPEALREDALFDVASLSKVLATTWGALLLLQDGRLQLDAPLGDALPLLRDGGWQGVSLRQLLQHRSGAAAWLPLYVSSQDRTAALGYLAEQPLAALPGTTTLYSDLGFMVLGALIEAVSGQRLDAFLQGRLFGPLGLHDAVYRPGAQHQLVSTSHGDVYEQRMIDDPRIGVGYRGPARSQDFAGWRQHTLRGEVNDCNAHHAWGGVAGHAGLFCSAAAAVRLCDAYFLPEDGLGVGQDLRAACLAGDPMGGSWGWRSGEVYAPGAKVHLGFTGTFALVLPDQGVSLVVLTNRQHARRDWNFVDLRGMYKELVHQLLEGINNRSPRASGR